MWVALMGLGVLAIFVFDAAAGAAVEVVVLVFIAAITLAATVLALVAIVDARRRPAAAQAAGAALMTRSPRWIGADRASRPGAGRSRTASRRGSRRPCDRSP